MSRDRGSFLLRCKRTIRELAGPGPTTIDGFVQRLAERRGRPIVRVPARLGGQVACGLFVSTDDVDYIIHEVGVTPLHANHIAAHEVSHLVLGHYGSESAPMTAESLARTLLPAVDPGTIRALFGRTIYDEWQEQDAETFASVLMVESSSPSAVLRMDDGAERDQLQSLFDVAPRQWGR
jgi:hypothetical protein